MTRAVKVAWLILRMLAATVVYLAVVGPFMVLWRIANWWHYGPAQAIVDRLESLGDIRGFWQYLLRTYRYNIELIDSEDQS